MRRIVGIGLLGLMGTLWAADAGQDRSTVVLVDPFAPLPPVYVADIRDRVLADAGREVASCLEAMTGRQTVVRHGHPPPGTFAISVSPEPYRHWSAWTGRDDAGDAAWWRVSSSGIEISGPGSEGVALSVYRFLDSAGGVRWFWPGPLGRVVPTRLRWDIPAGLHRESPAFESRAFSGLSRDGEIWAMRNGIRNHYPGIHGLRLLFSREDFLANPLLAAEPFDPENPPPAGSRFWEVQPALWRADTVDHVAAAVIARFRASPRMRSISLGPADNLRFGHSETLAAVLGPHSWFRQRPDYSDLIFGFANEIAERVAEEFPDHTLVVLAYQYGENVPSFPVHPMVMPLLTADRAEGFDRAFDREDRQLVRQWLRSGARRVAIYDYWHGGPYPFPRLALGLWTERLAHAEIAGVRAVRGELNPIWPFDGPKGWILARAMWEGRVNPEALLREFCVAFFGPAAGAMERYYQSAEDVWMGQSGEARWIRLYGDPWAVLLFSPEAVGRMSEALAEAHQAVGEGSSPVHQRLGLVEAAHRYFLARVDLATRLRGAHRGEWALGTDELNRLRADLAVLPRLYARLGGSGVPAPPWRDVGVPGDPLELCLGARLRRGEPIPGFVPGRQPGGRGATVGRGHGEAASGGKLDGGIFARGYRSG